jgi:hypothetical protein
MGNFLVVVPAPGTAREAKALFYDTLRAAKEIRSQAPAQTLETEWSYCASFARLNGSGGALVTDPKTGSWLVAVGTWFHQDAYASGAESRLLQRYLQLDNPGQLGRELEGFFALTFGDSRTRQIFLLTDLLGSCGVFWRALPDGIVLSGSSLLLAALRKCKLDAVGAQEFLNTGVIYEDRTCYQDIRKLAPAMVYGFSTESQAPTQQYYWRAADLAPESLQGEAAVDALWCQIGRAAKRIAGEFSQPVCDLTGGYDSRAVAACLIAAKVPFATTVFGTSESADVVISRGLAKRLELPHLHSEPLCSYSFERFLASLPLTDGEYDLVNYVQIREIHEKLSEKFTISINGSFGEVARGYWWELLFPFIGAQRPLNAKKLAALRYAAQDYDDSLFPSPHRLNMTEHFAGVIERTNAGLCGFPNTFQMDHAYLMMRMQRWQGRIASSTNQVWPCLSPFMFRPVLETMLQAGSLLRWRSLLVRKMLAKFSPQLASYPLEHGFPAEPVSWRNVHRFAPLGPYFAKKVVGKAARTLGVRRAIAEDSEMTPRLQLWNNERVRETLLPGTMKLSSWLDPSALESFLKRSTQRDFAFGDQWARLLSLECALRAADRVARARTDSHAIENDRPVMR